MNPNQNTQVLERLQAVYSAVLQLSEQGFNIEAVNLNGARPKLRVTQDPTALHRHFKEMRVKAGAMEFELVIAEVAKKGCES